MKHLKNFQTFEGHFFPNGKNFLVTFKIERDELISESGISNLSDAFDNEMKYVENSGIGLIKKTLKGNSVEAVIEVDPDTLNEIEGYEGKTLTEIVHKELQWLLGSGILVDKVEEVEY
jgi:hypothetical protein